MGTRAGWQKQCIGSITLRKQNKRSRYQTGFDYRHFPGQVDDTSRLILLHVMILFPLPTNTSLHYLCSLELSEKKAATISSCKELLNAVPFSQVSPCKIIEQATFWWTLLFPGDLTTVAPFIFSIIFQTYQDIRFP